MGEQGEGRVLLEPAHPVADLLGADRGLVIGGGVHHHEVVAVAVEVLRLVALDPGPAELLLGPEGLLGDGSGGQVLELGADHRGAAAKLDVGEVEDLEQLATPLDRGSRTEVSCIDHRVNSPLSRTIRVAASRAIAYPAAPRPRITASAASAVSITRR